MRFKKKETNPSSSFYHNILHTNTHILSMSVLLRSQEFFLLRSQEFFFFAYILSKRL